MPMKDAEAGPLATTRAFGLVLASIFSPRGESSFGHVLHDLGKIAQAPFGVDEARFSKPFFP